MPLFKWIGSALVVAAAVFAIHQRVVMPCRCTRIERRVEVSTIRIADLPADSHVVPDAARTNLAALQTCLSQTPPVSMLMIAAANHRLLDRPRDAIAFYERAMALDRRPELYFNLGMAQIEAGDTKQGVQNVIYTCIFNPELRSHVTLHHAEISAAVDRYQIYIQGLKQAKR